ncbi:hypothetical protein [Nonomuraea sp. NPDC048901]|uniref:hypothetical protein n=1 Tax=Nonomuraea sp. NPDC048901 TaxID=3155627 RepID=UPI00340A0B8C
MKTGQHLTQEITVEQRLTEFLNRKRKIEETTRRSYEGHIRLYLTPYLGRLRLEQLKVSDLALMFEQIEEFNDTIAERRADPDSAVRESVKYRRPTSVTTMHNIRATLRYALNMAMRQDRLIISTALPCWRCRPRPVPDRWSGPRTGSAPGRRTTAPIGRGRSSAGAGGGSIRSTPTPACRAPHRSWCGRPRTPAGSSKKPKRTACSPSTSSSPSAGYAGARRAGCAGRKSTSTATL